MIPSNQFMVFSIIKFIMKPFQSIFTQSTTFYESKMNLKSKKLTFSLKNDEKRVRVA